MKKIYVVIKRKFPSKPILYMAKYLATYAQRNNVFFKKEKIIITIIPTPPQQ